MSKGIDYGMGRTNIDHATGIRFGCISQNAVFQAWCDESEGYYGEPTCGECCGPAIDVDESVPIILEDDSGNVLHGWKGSQEHSCQEYVCLNCKRWFSSDEVYSNEALSHYIDNGEYLAESCLDTDILILKSPYYTRAKFCSPCVPGAGNLESPCNDGERSYCFGPDWFDDESPCPYPVWEVETDKLVYTPNGRMPFHPDHCVCKECRDKAYNDSAE